MRRNSPKFPESLVKGLGRGNLSSMQSLENHISGYAAPGEGYVSNDEDIDHSNTDKTDVPPGSVEAMTQKDMAALSHQVQSASLSSHDADEGVSASAEGCTSDTNVKSGQVSFTTEDSQGGYRETAEDTEHSDNMSYYSDDEEEDFDISFRVSEVFSMGKTKKNFSHQGQFCTDFEDSEMYEGDEYEALEFEGAGNDENETDRPTSVSGVYFTEGFQGSGVPLMFQFSDQDSTLPDKKSGAPEVWDGLGHTDQKSCGDDDATLSQTVQALCRIVFHTPFGVTSKDHLVSKLNISSHELQKVLHACEERGIIDYNSMGYIRLTDKGKEGVKELLMLEESSGTMNSAIQGGPPPSPAQLLQENPIYGHSFKLDPEVPKKPAGRGIIAHFDRLNNPGGLNSQPGFKPGQISQLPTSQNKSRDLKPWLSSVELTTAASTGSLPSQMSAFHQQQQQQQPSSLPFMPGATSSDMPRSLSLSAFSTSSSSSSSSQPTSLTFGQQLLRDKKTIIPDMEYLILSDNPEKAQGLVTLVSAPEPIPQRRLPLLSTPLTRGSNPAMKLPQTGMKAPLLPHPGQPSQQGVQPVLAPQPKESLHISTESFAALNKNPISAFMEYGQSRRLPARIDILSQRGPPHKPVFVVAAILGNRVFPGITSSNKKDGKKEAAEQAMRMLIAEGQYNVSQNAGLMSIPEENMTMFDKIAAITHRKFNHLIATIPESLVGRKVIAGLVLKMNEADVGSVIAVGSGNRCITGDKLSLQGKTVNDCHAEIITRRGFMRFLYHQLKSYDAGKDHPLFEPSPTGKLKIKDNVSFHLYISTAPCGDGALFSPRDVEANTGPVTEACVKHKPTFDTSVQGVLRTKMEGGEGTIPMDPSKPVQTWDGIVRGERLRTMSCSDKICRWNVLGLQGALLAHFLDPIYLDSITLGFLFDAGHLSRAVCCRLDRGDPPLDSELASPYMLKHPRLGRVTACEPTRETQKTKAFSVNWMAEDDRPEVVDGSVGTCYSGESKGDSSGPPPSRLCKRYMYDQFQDLCRQFGRQELLSAKSYYMAKRMSSKFLHAKQILCDKFVSTGCGTWLDKPIEEKMFS